MHHTIKQLKHTTMETISTKALQVIKAVKEATSKFKAHMDDIMDIAKSKCLKGSVEIAGTPGPRDVNPYSPPQLEELREYKGYY